MEASSSPTISTGGQFVAATPDNSQWALTGRSISQATPAGMTEGPGGTASPSNGNITNRRVLILNQNYEPLSLCTVRRAIVMTLRGAAEVVETHTFLAVRTVSHAFPAPSVVRLGQYIRPPTRNVILNRKNLLIRDNYRCQYCGVKLANLTIDHIRPRQKGGEDTWENLVCACPRCNSMKGDRTPERAGMKLLSRPRRPHQINFIRQFAANGDPAWRPYLFME